VDDYSTDSFTVLWDSTFESWVSIGISGQPTFVLLDTNGTELGRWNGLNESEVLALAANA